MRYPLTLFAYFLVLVLPSLCVRPILENTYPNYWQKRWELEQTYASGALAYSIGTSHATAIYSNTFDEELGLSIYHSRTNGGDLFELIYEMKSIKQHNPRARLFIVCISPFSFHYDNNAYVKDGSRIRREQRVKVYSEFDNFTTLINRDPSNYLLALFYPVITPDHLEKLTWFHKTPDKREAETPLENEACEPGSKSIELSEHGKKRTRNVFRDNLIPNMSENAGYDIPERSGRMLKEFVQGNPDDLFIFYTPPYWKEYREGVPDDVRTRLAEVMQGIVRHGNAMYHDYSALRPISETPCYFVNADHLNSDGAEAFSKIFVADLLADRRIKRFLASLRSP